MKRKAFIHLILAGAIISGVTSCREGGEDLGSQGNINSLQAVSFSDQASKVISSEKTGYTRYNPANSTTEYEYLNVVEKTHTLSPLSFVDARNNDVIYPGSILIGESFMKGSYDPLVTKTPYKDVMVSVSLRGANFPVKASSKPILSEIRNTTNGLVAKYKSEIDYSFVPAYVSYQANSVNTTSSFNKSFNLHANANVLKGLVSAKFSYEDSFKSSSSQKYVMIKLQQVFYNASIDPKHFDDWFDGTVNTKDFGSYEPVYVSSVDYGRTAYLLIETNESEEETKKMISGGVNFAFNAVSGSVEASYNRTLKKMFQESKIRALIVGGPARLGGQISDYNSFIEFIKTPSIDDLVSSAAPVSYKIRRLKDNTEVEVKEVLSEKELQYKAN